MAAAAAAIAARLSYLAEERRANGPEDEAEVIAPDMADNPEPQPEDPFRGIPFLGDIAKAMSGQGPINWDAARQFAQLGATGGEQEANVDPASRMALEALVPIAQMHVGDLTSSDLTGVDIVTLSRSQWAADTLDSYRPLFTDLATALSRRC